MPNRLVPVISSDPTAPPDVVESFLAALARPDLPAAVGLLHPDICYTNVGLPALRGRHRVGRALALLDRQGCAFEVYLHAVAAESGVVLTERTDVLRFGPLRLQFWVTGRFDVVDGQITLWRDSYDYLDLTRALVRGLAGVVVPPLRPRPPASAQTLPGRH